MTIVYAAIFALSVLMPIGYFLFVLKKKREPWLLVLNISVCAVNLGYMLLSVSKTVEFALVANKIAYLGQAFVPLCMFMIISGLCGFSYNKRIKYALIGAAIIMFGIVLTTGHLDWYYKSVELIEADGAAKLIKEYGVLHPTNLIYVLAYFVAMLAVIGISLKRNRGTSHKLAGLMLAVVIGNIGMWLIEKLITWSFEFLSISYLMSEFVFFFVYWLLQDYIHISDIPATSFDEGMQTVFVVDTLTTAQKLQNVLNVLAPTKPLTKRQTEILQCILEGKNRKEIALELHISENTVKTHTASLYSVLGVSGKDEIISLSQKI